MKERKWKHLNTIRCANYVRIYEFTDGTDVRRVSAQVRNMNDEIVDIELYLRELNNEPPRPEKEPTSPAWM